MSKKRKLIINMLIISILAILVVLFFFARFAPFIRFWYSLRTLFLDLANYFCVLFTGKPFIYKRVYHLVLQEPLFEFPFLSLPINDETFIFKTKISFRLLVNGQNLKVRFYGLFIGLLNLIRSLPILISFVAIMNIVFTSYFEVNDLSFVDKSKELEKYDRFMEGFVKPIKRFIIDLINTVRYRTYYSIPLLIILFLHLNIFSIILDFIGLVLYLSSTFNFISLYQFLYVFFLSVEPIVRYVPFPIWAGLAFMIFKKWQYKTAIKKLYHLDNKNKGFLKSLGVVINFKGPPGAGKSTMLVDAGFNFDEIFRTNFYNTLEEYQAYFPDFPWSEYEVYLRWLIQTKRIKNRHFIKVLVAKLFYTYEKSGNFKFTYNLETQRRYISLGNKVVFLEDALITYGEAFFYYSYNSTLISGNISVRYDSILFDDLKHFPLWNYDALTIDPYESLERERYSKNIDFDSLRLYKKIQDDNNHPIYDIGVVMETEAAKQWGNQNDNSVYKRDDSKANPLNDGFVEYLSTFRHGSLINYEPYLRYLMDFQRKGDMQAKIGELAETTINIFTEPKQKIMTLPLYYWTPIILEFIADLWSRYYTVEYRSKRNDRTLLFYLFNKIGSWARTHLVVVENKFGVTEKLVVTNLGSEDSNINDTKQRSYYFIHKKIYANRFASDALKRLHDDGTNVGGFATLKDYGSLYPTEQELLEQNSYFNNKKFGRKRVDKTSDDIL